MSGGDFRIGQLCNVDLSTIWNFTDLQSSLFYDVNLLFTLNEPHKDKFKSNKEQEEKKFVWNVGATYRSQFAIGFLVGTVISKKYEINLSFDVPTNTSDIYNTGTKEITIGYTPGNLVSLFRTAESHHSHYTTKKLPKKY